VIRGPIFVPQGFYHIYSRGNEKREIFLSDTDRLRFLKRLTEYIKKHSVTVLSYCLMPNHYHLLLRQDAGDSISGFIHKLQTAYAMYFNKRYERVGHLFQGRFGAKVIETDEYLLHLSRYIHLNPAEILKSHYSSIKSLSDYPWSSYPDYVGHRKDELVNTNFILNYFSKINPSRDYKSFVESSINEESLNDLKSLKNLMMEEPPRMFKARP